MAKKETVKYDNQQVAVLMDAFKKSYLTITRWIKNNDDRLTSDKAKEALSKMNR